MEDWCRRDTTRNRRRQVSLQHSLGQINKSLHVEINLGVVAFIRHSVEDQSKRALFRLVRIYAAIHNRFERAGYIESFLPPVDDRY